MRDVPSAPSAPRARAVQVAQALVSFAVPIALLCLSLRVSGVYPFGAESFLTEDLKYQYIDFFTWYRKVLLGEESLFYTFALSLGNDAWGLWSYYLASPFNLIIALFPENSLVFAIFLITALKLGCIGLASASYLRRRFSLSFGQVFVLSLCFSCSLWVFTQMRNPLWLDALILLPLVALGVWRCATEGRWGLLLGAIVAAIVTCWYTAYMIVLFSILLALAEWAIARFGGEPRVGFARLVTLMAGMFCLALLLAAWTFYPTIAAQLGAWSGGKTLALCGVSVVLGALSVAFLSGRLGRRATTWACRGLLGCLLLVAVLAAVLGGEGLLESLGASEEPLTAGKRAIISSPFIGSWELNSSPQLFAGYVPLLGTLCLLLCPRAGWQTRVAAAALVCVLFLSVILTPLYYIWCGFREPTGFYCRIAFFFVFALVWASGLYLSRFHPAVRPLREVAVPALLLALLHLVGSAIGEVDGGTMPLGLVLITIYAVYLCGKGASALRVAAPALVLGELAISACLALPMVYYGYDQEVHESYVEESSREIDALREIDDSVYRIEKTYRRGGLASLDESLALGFMSLSSYASSYDADAVSFLKALGYTDVNGFEVSYRMPILSSDSLLGVKYVFSRVPLNGLEEIDLEELAEGDLLYENPDALSLGYAASNKVCSLLIDDWDNPFELQNAFASAVLGREVELFEPLEATLVQDDAETRSWDVVVPAGKAAYAWIDSTSRTPYLYIVDDPSAVWANTEISGDHSPMDNGRWSHTPRMLGDVAEADRTTRVSLTWPPDSDRPTEDYGDRLPEDATCLFYALDMEAYDELVSELAREQLEVSQHSNARLTGTIEFSGEQDGLLITVPYDVGWTARVNGQIVEASEAADGALTFIPLDEAGSYEVDMSYEPPMLLAGCIVSLLAVAGLAVGGVRRQGAGKKGLSTGSHATRATGREASGGGSR